MKLWLAKFACVQTGLCTDRTNFVELLEERYSSIFFLRPRKFGKSLFLSMLDYYYNINHKEYFERLFAQFYIKKTLQLRS